MQGNPPEGFMALLFFVNTRPSSPTLGVSDGNKEIYELLQFQVSTQIHRTILVIKHDGEFWKRFQLL